MKKPSFFERFTSGDDDFAYDDLFEDERPRPNPNEHEENPAPGEERKRQISVDPHSPASRINREEWLAHEQEEGDLSIDVYQTDDSIVVKALVAGVLPANLDISVTRDMVTIEGMREDEREVEDGQYFQRELYWGAFTRTILLPEEIDVDQAEATEKHGVLMIRLPKINKTKSTKLKVRAR